MVDASWSGNLNEPYVRTNMFYHDNTDDQDLLLLSFLFCEFDMSNSLSQSLYKQNTDTIPMFSSSMPLRKQRGLLGLYHGLAKTITTNVFQTL